ncbi:leukosialin [Platysternon megacephalum]|uniref:Leukosialin n=1 Tax=Platysternon megacephalum TaxID=55544 RepID=A0A4D9DSK9_9SAUR|nr:leukosialin [Platysternon megacephalum]
MCWCGRLQRSQELAGRGEGDWREQAITQPWGAETPHNGPACGPRFDQAEGNARAALARCCSPCGGLRTGANAERVFPAGQRVGEQVLSQDPPGCVKRNTPSWGEREESGGVSCRERRCWLP